MSIANEITRIQTDRNTIRAKLVELGLVGSAATLDACATAIENIAKHSEISVEILEGASYNIPAGYHDGSGIVKAMTDTAGEEEKYKTQTKTVTPTKQQLSVTPDQGNYALSSVVVKPIPDNYQDVSSTTSAAGDVLTGKVFVMKDGTVTTGTMPNNGAVTKTLDVNTVQYVITAGYHNGSGKVSISLETKSVTPNKSAQEIKPSSGKVLSKVTVNPIPAAYQDVTGVTATADKVLTGSKFVDADGNVVDGTMPYVEDVGVVWNVINGYVTVKKGYHHETESDIPKGTLAEPSVYFAESTGIFSATASVMESGYISTSDIEHSKYQLDVQVGKTVTPTKSEQTAVDAYLYTTGAVKVAPIPDEYQDITRVTAYGDDVLEGKLYVNADGELIDGSMPNNGSVSLAINGMSATTSVTIPEGYHNGTGAVSLTNDVENALKAI